MKTLSILFLSALCACGQSTWRNVAFVGSLTTAASGGSSYIAEDFEETGLENGWGQTSGANFDWDYAVAPAPLAGTQSFYTQMAAASYVATNAFTASDELYGFFLLLYTNTPSSNDQYPMRLLNGATAVAGISPRTDGFIYFAAGTSSVKGPAYTVGRTNALWWHWVKGTGANATMEIWLQDNGTQTKPESITAQTSSGNATLQANVYRISGGQTNGVIIDNILVGPTAYGSNPQIQ